MGGWVEEEGKEVLEGRRCHCVQNGTEIWSGGGELPPQRGGRNSCGPEPWAFAGGKVEEGARGGRVAAGNLADAGWVTAPISPQPGGSVTSILIAILICTVAFLTSY